MWPRQRCRPAAAPEPPGGVACAGLRGAKACTGDLSRADTQGMGRNEYAVEDRRRGDPSAAIRARKAVRCVPSACSCLPQSRTGWLGVPAGEGGRDDRSPAPTRVRGFSCVTGRRACATRADRQPRRAARGSGAPAAGLPLQREVLVPPRSQAPSAQYSGRMLNPYPLNLQQNRWRCPRSGSDPSRKADMSPKIAEVDELPHSRGHLRPDVGRRRDHCEPLCACAALDDACGSCASKIDTSTWRAQSITAASVRSLPPTRAVLGLGIRT